MIKLDFDWTLKSLANKPLEGDEDAIHAGKALAGLLTSATESSAPIKYFDWALKLYNKQPLEVDSQDYEELKKFIKEHKRLFVIAQAQLLQYIIDAKGEEEKKKLEKSE